VNLAGLHARGITPCPGTMRPRSSHPSATAKSSFRGALSPSADGRGVTYAHLCGLTSGCEYPSRRSIELIAASSTAITHQRVIASIA
jgi:hypothetical protein